MPKIRDAVYSLEDAQKHMIVFRTRIGNNLELAKEADKVIAMLNTIAADIPKELNKEKSLLNKDLNNAAVLFEKELKKNDAKIDYGPIVRAIYNANNQKDAYKLGLKHSIDPQQIKMLMTRAPINTNLGKVMAQLKLDAMEEKQAKLYLQQSPIPKTPEPIKQKPVVSAAMMFEQDEELNDQTTINSDEEIDAELKKVLMGDE